MAVPKKKTSRARRDKRRAHDAIKYTAAVEYCPSCGEPKLRHHMCTACGAYRGLQIGANKVAGDAVEAASE